ncbi:acyl transferase domain-containing protein [Luteibacter jiangsuensis]|uniref:Acyl transferase domain-containing protein n=1 Tax=Luteibacter jiangsuensis TaxID=637577 RepID=A0ABT9SW62_9GAMM|nr:polyketide synthase [Luteibacter jiangsuensis]MDQ0009245.1 acyl transferase domain-containing protein [Luteibacter jiangsuensis]
MIAIAGMSCHFPGAEGLDAYWRLISANRSAIGDPPAYRREFIRQAEVLQIPVRGGYIEHEGRFDPRLFHIPEREAARMDPQQKLVLIHACRALEDAGLTFDEIGGSRTGVFVGAMTNDLAYLKWGDVAQTLPEDITGNGLCLIANRLSYELDLRGPSMTIDTACSSSLVAMHHAVRSLREFECDFALVAGVNVILSTLLQKFYRDAGVGASDGGCRSYSRDANGMGRSEGVGVLLLQREQDLPVRCRKSYAAVNATGVNHGGQSNRFTAPSVQAQVELLRQTYASAGIQPHEIAYVEGHGTGIQQGDLMEIRALQQVFSGRDPPCWLGSIKSLIGHAEAASGIAGVIKIALMIHYAHIPPSAYADSPAPLLDACSPVQLMKAMRSLNPRRRHFMGVSAFGLGGTNAHALLTSHRFG